MTDGSDKKTNDLEAEFRKLVIDELKSISAKQQETTQSLNDLTTEFKLHKQESQSRWDAIAKLDTEQNSILAEHSARSHELKRQNELMEKALRADIFGEGLTDPDHRQHTVVGRIEKLEEPRKIVQATKAVLITIGKIAGAFLAIYGLLKLFFPNI